MNALETLLRLAPQLADGMKPGPGHIMVRCPYHGDGMEKTPSMSISTWKPVWFCHSCKASGHMAQLLGTFGLSKDAISAILPRSENYTKPETVATKILKGGNPFKGKFILDEGILDVYRLAPTSLKNAGYKPATLRHFEVGFDNKNYRITYPLRTAFGDLVGISGRSLYPDWEPRYKIYDRELKERTDYNIPDSYTMEEVKSGILWHAHVIRPFFFLKKTGASASSSPRASRPACGPGRAASRTSWRSSAPTSPRCMPSCSRVRHDGSRSFSTTTKPESRNRACRPHTLEQGLRSMRS